MKIKVIDEDMVKRLYDSGIEDLRLLAVAADEGLKMESFDIRNRIRRQYG